MPPVGKLDASGSPWISSLPGERGDGRAVADRAVERVVLLGGETGQRLEPVRVVGGPALERPVLHRRGDDIGDRRVEFFVALDRALQRTVDLLGQPLALLGRSEDVGAEYVCGLVLADRSTCAPLGGVDVRESHLGHQGRGPSWRNGLPLKTRRGMPSGILGRLAGGGRLLEPIHRQLELSTRASDRHGESGRSRSRRWRIRSRPGTGDFDARTSLAGRVWPRGQTARRPSARRNPACRQIRRRADPRGCGDLARRGKHDRAPDAVEYALPAAILCA